MQVFGQRRVGRGWWLNRLAGWLIRLVCLFLVPYYCLRGYFRRAPQIRILRYQKVAPLPSEQAVPYENVSPAKFARQMGWLAEQGYQTLTVSELAAQLAQGRLPARARIAVITFDDGYKNNFLYAYPILQQHRLRASFFLRAGQIGKQEFFSHLWWDETAVKDCERAPENWLPLSWADVREMAAAGHEFGLRLIPAGDDAAAINALVNQSQEVFLRELNYLPTSCSYRALGGGFAPYLARHGIQAACHHTAGVVSVKSDHWQLARFTIHERDNWFDFYCKLNGAADWLGWCQRLWQKLPSLLGIPETSVRDVQRV